MPYTSLPPAANDASSVSPSQRLQSARTIPIVFWCLGLLNNTAYVIMLASAKSISEGGTALVFLANIVPSLSIKLSAPYWFDRVSYHTRILVSAVLMGSSFIVVAVFSGNQASSSIVSSPNYEVAFQLVGVALASAQCGLGEASLLALAGKCARHGPCLACFSSGTGLAGVFGFLWKFVWNDWLGFSLRQTLGMATILAVFYAMVYVRHLWNIHNTNDEDDDCLKSSVVAADIVTNTNGTYQATRVQDSPFRHESPLQKSVDHVHDDNENDQSKVSSIAKIEDMRTGQRMRLVLSLYPYMIPLFVVYAAEYALQSGTWTAIGFPVTSMVARNDFYEYSNWMYQAGVFISRSSGTLFTAPMSILWLMPLLQSINVIFFWWVAARHVWYNYTLLIPCFYVGLLGGAVYINGYTRICADLPMEHREFALSSTSVAEGLGVLVADLFGLLLQSCLYRVNGLQGAVVSCPLPE